MKVAQVSKPGAGFQIVEREIPEPGLGQVRIKVQTNIAPASGRTGLSSATQGVLFKKTSTSPNTPTLSTIP